MVAEQLQVAAKIPRFHNFVFFFCGPIPPQSRQIGGRQRLTADAGSARPLSLSPHGSTSGEQTHTSSCLADVLASPKQHAQIACVSAQPPPPKLSQGEVKGCEQGDRLSCVTISGWGWISKDPPFLPRHQLSLSLSLPANSDAQKKGQAVFC